MVLICWRNNHFDIREFTTTTGLFFVHLAVLGRSCDRLFVRYLRSTLVDLYLKLTFQAVDQDIQVKLTHTFDNCLTGFFVRYNYESRIFFSQFTQCSTQFVDASSRFRLNRQTDYRLCKSHRLQCDSSFPVSDSTSGHTNCKTNPCTDITGTDTLDWVLLVCVQ